MKEEFLHYLWHLGKFDLHDLRTTKGEPITILNRGQWNYDAGPDFLHAKVKIGEIQWEGSVEIHLRSAEWDEHKHQEDPAYNNVVLHVVLEEDKVIHTQVGNTLPTLELKDRIPAGIMGRYKALSASLEEIPCHTMLGKLDSLRIRQWLERLAVQRLERKSATILQLYDHNNKDWEHTLFLLLCKYMGGKVNANAFQQLAQRVDVRIIWKNKPFIQQLEAYLMGLAGLLPLETDEVYPRLLEREFEFLQSKWGLQSMRAVNWRFFRMRPSNFPTVRIAQLAKMYHNRGRWLPWLLQAELEELKQAFCVSPSAYWQTHYVFNKKSEGAATDLGFQQFLRLMINVVIPFRFAYATHERKEGWKTSALELLEALPSEQNRIIRKWKGYGIRSSSALESQALIELLNEGCKKRKCLQCAFGNYFLRTKTTLDVVEETYITLMSR